MREGKLLYGFPLLREIEAVLGRPNFRQSNHRRSRSARTRAIPVVAALEKPEQIYEAPFQLVNTSD